MGRKDVGQRPFPSDGPPAPQQGGGPRERRSRTPWLTLWFAGLLVGTVGGRLVDDVALGLAYGFAGVLVVGALWSSLLPYLRRLLPGGSASGG